MRLFSATQSAAVNGPVEPAPVASFERAYYSALQLLKSGTFIRAAANKRSGMSAKICPPARPLFKRDESWTVVLLAAAYSHTELGEK